MKNIILIITFLMSLVLLSCNPKDISDEKIDLTQTPDAKKWTKKVAEKKAMSKTKETYTFDKNADLTHNNGKKEIKYKFAGTKNTNEAYYYTTINLQEVFTGYSNVPNDVVYQYAGFIIEPNGNIVESDITIEAISNQLYWIGSNIDLNNADWKNFPATKTNDIAWTNTTIEDYFVFTD